MNLLRSILFHLLKRKKNILLIITGKFLQFIFYDWKYFFFYQQFILSLKEMSKLKASIERQGPRKSSSVPKRMIGKSTIEYLQSIDRGNFIRQEENIAKRERHGLFNQPLGLAPGDPYKDPEISKPEKRFQVNQHLQQKIGVAVFSNLGTINLNDPYKDSFRANQLYIKEKGDLSIHSHALRAGGKQKLVRHSEFEHIKQFNDKQYKTIATRKNISANKMKKGYKNTGAQHLFSSYPYRGYPEEDLRKKDKQQRIAHQAKIGVPFKSTFHPNTEIPQQAIYKDEPYRQKKDDQIYREKSINQWKYNSPNKKSYNGAFSNFPLYIEEGEKHKKELKETKPWIPNFNGTSKGTGETLNRPCMPPSQMIINEIKRTRA